MTTSLRGSVATSLRGSVATSLRGSVATSLGVKNRLAEVRSFQVFDF